MIPSQSVIYLVTYMSIHRVLMMQYNVELTKHDRKYISENSLIGECYLVKLEQWAILEDKCRASEIILI